MLPLSRALMMASTGAGAQEAELRVSHAKTTLSFYALVGGEAICCSSPSGAGGV